MTFSCTPIATITCNFNPAQIAAGSGHMPVQLIISTAGPNAPAGNNKLRRWADRRFPWFPLTLPLAGIVMVGCAGRRISKHITVAGLGVSLVLLGLLLACGGGGNSTPPPTAPTAHKRHRRSGNTGESLPQRCRRQLATANGAIYSDGHEYHQQGRNLGSDNAKWGNDRREWPLHSSHGGRRSSDKCEHHRDFGSRRDQIRDGHRDAERSHDPHANRATLHHLRVCVRGQYSEQRSGDADRAVGDSVAAYPTLGVHCQGWSLMVPVLPN